MKLLNSFLISKNGDKLLRFLFLLFLVLLYINRDYLNFTVRTQILYFVIPLVCGYVLREIFIFIFFRKHSVNIVSLFFSIIDITTVYEDIVISINRIKSLKLKKGLSILISLGYVFTVLIIARLNGGFDKSSVKLLFTSIPFLIFFLLYMDDYMAKLYKFWKYLLLIGLFLLFHFILASGFVFALDLLTVFIAVWIVFLGVIYDREKIYSLSLLFLIAIPVFSLFSLNIYAEFSANCAYMLLLLGVFKDLFYSLVFKD